MNCPKCGSTAKHKGDNQKTRRYLCRNTKCKYYFTTPIAGSPSQNEGDFALAAIPTTSFDPSEAERLLQLKCEQYEKRIQAHNEQRILTYPAGSKPIGIVHFGDPHVDDNGADLPLLKKHVELIKSNPGVLAGNIGDNTNNWVGRLTKLYANQVSTFDEGLTLAEWLLDACNWLYFVNGNHDGWNDGSTVLRLMMRGKKVFCHAPHEGRIRMQFNNGVVVNLLARHDLPGRSWFHTTHGAKKWLMLDPWPDLVVSGHTHEWGEIKGETQDGRPKWGIRARGYKRMDDYAAVNGFYEHQHGAAALSIINPYAPPTERIQNYFDVEYGLRILRMLRGD